MVRDVLELEREGDGGLRKSDKQSLGDTKKVPEMLVHAVRREANVRRSRRFLCSKAISWGRGIEQRMSIGSQSANFSCKASFEP